MCGICGTVRTDGATPAEDDVRRMLAAMKHRGPDAQGLFVEPGVAAGVQRLAVIDVAGGGQPIESEDGRVVVVYNGEIYNFRELRADLEARGHRFRTRADTEVLVHLWEDDGPGMLARLHGMFAFCLHDRRTRETLLARDRLGIKPLHVAEIPGGVAFASEVAVLLRHREVRAEVDSEALLEMYCLQYALGEGTPYRGIRKMPPGSAMLLRDGAVRAWRWWKLPAPAPVPGDPRERADELRGLVERAVRERLVADVPLGMFLSGGIDSTAILSIASRALDGPVRTFSVGFEEAGFDERRFARLAAERFGAEHRELVVSAEDVGRHLPRLVEHLAEPVLDPAMIPTWLLSEFARREVTVALSGEGADELFGGYRRYRLQRRWGFLGRLPGVELAARVAGRSMPGRSGQALEAMARSDAARNHLRWASTVSPRVARGLFGREAYARFEARAAEALRPYFTEGPSRLAGQLRADQGEWLPHDLLAKVDRASMAFSLEARVPFLDHRIVEWAALQPDRLKIAQGVGKWILRAAFRDDVPRGILTRPKRGFDLPLGAWMRGPLRPLALELFTRSALSRFPELDADFALALMQDHLRGRDELGLPLFNLLSLLLFLNTRAGRV